MRHKSTHLQEGMCSHATSAELLLCLQTLQWHPYSTVQTPQNKRQVLCLHGTTAQFLLCSLSCLASCAARYRSSSLPALPLLPARALWCHLLPYCSVFTESLKQLAVFAGSACCCRLCAASEASRSEMTLHAGLSMESLSWFWSLLCAARGLLGSCTICTTQQSTSDSRAVG
jgi:hypothetical protein